MGVAMATTTSTALSELSEDRAGVGSAVLQALNKVGGPFGSAVLGSVLSSVYIARLELSVYPAPAARCGPRERLRWRRRRPRLDRPR